MTILEYNRFRKQFLRSNLVTIYLLRAKSSTLPRIYQSSLINRDLKRMYVE